jgi:hypothetical protein
MNTRGVTMQKIIPITQQKYNPKIVDRLYDRIRREKQGNVGINKISVVEFHYGTNALTTGRIPKKAAPETFANDLWKTKNPKAEAIRA